MYYPQKSNGSKTSIFIIIFTFIMIIPTTAIIVLTTTTTVNPVYGQQDKTNFIQQIHQTYKVFQQKKFR
jgi:hypothetical protein